jgi:hypothetical protein
MNDAIARMLDRYECQSIEDYVRALREIMQEIALLGLWRSKFFEKAAFYGGTALRILCGMDRFSEDLDFSLINPMRDKGKAAASFGSYGWSGEAVGLIDNNLRSLKLNVIQDGLAVRFFPDAEQTKQLVQFGEKFGEKLKENFIG